VVRGAAGHQHDALDGLDRLVVQHVVGEHDGAALGLDPPAQGVGGGARLLVDLLQHEVPVPALLGQDGIPGDVHGRALHGRAVELTNLDTGAREHGHVLVLQHENVARVGKDGRNVRGDERLALAQPHDHAPSSLLGRDQPIGIRAREHGDGVGAAQLPERAADGFVEPRRVAQMALDQVGDHLGVGVRGEPMALARQPLLDREVVLDDAVVHDHEGAGVVGVGMGVLVGGTPVGRPARVADADATAHRAIAEEPFEHLDAARGPADLQAVGPEHGHAGGVIAAVFEPLEATEDDLDGALATDVAHDPAHRTTPRVDASGSSASSRPSPRERPAERA